MRRYLTEDELTEFIRLNSKLAQAVPHSKKAVRIGREIAKIHRQAHMRNNPPNLAIDRAMARLAKRLGL